MVELRMMMLMMMMMMAVVLIVRLWLSETEHMTLTPHIIIFIISTSPSSQNVEEYLLSMAGTVVS